MINDDLENFDKVILDIICFNFLFDKFKVFLVEDVFEDDFLIFLDSLVLNS
jgi:hypothetical protein